MRTKFLGLLLALVMLVACGDDGVQPKPKGTTPSVTEDAGNEEDAEEPASLCPEDFQLVCGGFCIDVRYDNDNCGSCGNVCPNQTMSCVEGSCECRDDDLTMCGGLCWDTSKTRDHCGTCGNSCDSGDACVDGDCVEISDVPEIIGVLEQTNIKRSATQDCGEYGTKFAVGPLQLNSILNAAAQKHAEDMATNNFMAHEGSDGSSPGERADREGYPSGFVGENVARGYDTPVAVVQGWTNSDGHCRNMMNGDYDELGVGFSVSNGGEEFWVQLFGRSPR